MHHQYILFGMAYHPHINAHGQYEFWRDPYYKRYIEKYGYHFNEHTFKEATEAMVKVDGTHKIWSSREVTELFSALKKCIPYGYSEWDVAYVANMFYADYYGSSVKSEQQCLEMAFDYLSDPDGYKEAAFSNWINGLMFKACVIDWCKMI